MRSPTHKEMYVNSLRVNRNLFQSISLQHLEDSLFPCFIKWLFFPGMFILCSSGSVHFPVNLKPIRQTVLSCLSALLFSPLPLSSSIFIPLPCCPLQLTSYQSPVIYPAPVLRAGPLAQFLPKVSMLIPCIKAQICHVICFHQLPLAVAAWRRA